MKVIVAVQTRAIMREIEIAGAERIKAKRLRKEIKLRLNQPVNEQQLEEARQKIIEVYQGRGFTDVSVHPAGSVTMFSGRPSVRFQSNSPSRVLPHRRSGKSKRCLPKCLTTAPRRL